MKFIKVALLLLLVTSCSSGRLALSSDQNSLETYMQDDKMIGDPLPSWALKQSSIVNGRLYVTGFSEMSADKSPYYIANAALMDGETKLLSGAPGDFRIITQNSLNGANIDSSEFFQVQTKMQEVLAVQGIKQHDHTCRKIVRFGETRNRVVRSCWYQVSANIDELVKAYTYTVKRKYGIDKSRKFEKLMNQELNKIQQQKRELDEVSNSKNSNSYDSFASQTSVSELPKAHNISQGL